MKIEFAHEILQSCEKSNRMGNSQTKCFIYLCVHLCLRSEMQPLNDNWEACVPQRRSYESEVRPLLRLQKTVFCSNVHPFGFISFWIPHQQQYIHFKMHIDTKTRRSKENHHISSSHKGPYLSERGECEGNEALTCTALKPHKEADCSLQSLPPCLTVTTPKEWAGTLGVHCSYHSLNVGISTVPMGFQ